MYFLQYDCFKLQKRLRSLWHINTYCGIASLTFMLSSVQHMQHMLQHSMYAFIYIRFLEAHIFTPPITWFLLHRLELLECFKINSRTYPCLVAQIYNTFSLLLPFSLSFDWKASWEQGHDAFCLGFCRLLITVYTGLNANNIPDPIN